MINCARCITPKEEEEKGYLDFLSNDSWMSPIQCSTYTVHSSSTGFHCFVITKEETKHKI